MVVPANRKTIDPTLIERDGNQLVSKKNNLGGDSQSFLLDRQWAKQAFLTSDVNIPSESSYDKANRYWSTAAVKFTDTRLGGNIGINARPQFTRYSDNRVKGRLSGRAPVSIQNTGGNYGMGRYYSEAIDDNAQTIYLRFGQPQFNSLLNFFSNAFDKDMMTLARTGRGPSAWYRIGQVAGAVVFVSALPAVAATIIAGKLLQVFFSRPTSKFYTLKPSMHLYWSTVNMLANAIAINKGIMPRILDDAKKDQGVNQPYKLDGEFLDTLHALMPDMFTAGHGYDVFAVANRAQRIANDLFTEDYERLNNGSDTDYTGYVEKSYKDNKLTDPPGERTLGSFINKFLMFGYYSSEKSKSRAEVNPKIDPDTGTITNSESVSIGNFFDAEFRHGSQFAVFKVDHTGTQQESFSNSTVESDLSTKFNGTSSDVREARFSFSDGNLSDGVIGGMVQGAIGAVSDVVTGAADSMTGGLFSNLQGLAGSGFIDIPKHWQSSNATLPKGTYTMQLISPYGNPISQMQNIFIPLAMIMAGGMPLSTGKQSYTSPFLVQVYDRGRCQIQLGMIDSFSISRGTANLPFTNRGQVTSIDVSFSVTDLSSIMHMPTSTGSLFGSDATTDEDNILMDYLAVLAGQDVYSQIYAIPKAKLRLAKKISQIQKLTSPAYWASLGHDSMTSGMLRYIFPIGQVIDAGVAGTSIIPKQ